MLSARRAVTLALACLCGLACCSCGPRMREQQSLQPYEREMPAMPAGTVPTRGRIQTLTAMQARLSVNPLKATKTNLANGRIYYGYYCAMCHGKTGKGDGKVGQAYVPVPTDLSSAKVKRMTEGQLYVRMLTGRGHDPVLVGTVPPGQRWQIVMHVRELGR